MSICKPHPGRQGGVGGPHHGLKSRLAFRSKSSVPRPTLTCRATNAIKDTLPPFPDDFPLAIKQAQQAALAALADGAQIIEVEFPSASVNSVAGDAEGANEMTYSMQHLRQFCRVFQDEAVRCLSPLQTFTFMSVPPNYFQYLFSVGFYSYFLPR